VWDLRVSWSMYSRKLTFQHSSVGGALERVHIFSYSEGTIVDFSDNYIQAERAVLRKVFPYLCYDASGESPDSPHLIMEPNSNCNSCGCMQSEAIVPLIVFTTSLLLSTT